MPSFHSVVAKVLQRVRQLEGANDPCDIFLLVTRKGRNNCIFGPRFATVWH